MERKYISIKELRKELSPKEMKIILGGSSYCWIRCDYGEGSFVRVASCAGEPEECLNYELPYGCYEFIECWGAK